MTTAFPYPSKDELNPEQRKFWDMLTLGERGFYTGGPDTKQLPDLYNAWLQFPPLGNVATTLGQEIRTRSELPGKLRELIVLTTSAHFGARVEYDFHVPFARDQGLSDALIEAIGKKEVPVFGDEAERIVYQANRQLMITATLEPETREQLISLLGFPGLMQVVATVTLYVVTAYTMNVAGAKLPENFSADPELLKNYYAGQPAANG